MRTKRTNPTDPPDLDASDWRSVMGSWSSARLDAWQARVKQLRPVGAAATVVEQAERWAFEDVATIEIPTEKRAGQPTAEIPKTPAGPPIPVEPEGPWMPTPTPWRKHLARMPIPDRQRWDDLSNALADQGVPWPEDERRAFVELFPELELPE